MKLKQILLSSVTALTVLVRGGNALAVTATTVVHDAKIAHTDGKDQPKPPDHGDHKDQASDSGDHKDAGDHKDQKH